MKSVFFEPLFLWLPVKTMVSVTLAKLMDSWGTDYALGGFAYISYDLFRHIPQKQNISEAYSMANSNGSGTPWSYWTNLGGQTIASPALVSNAPNSLYQFALGPDNRVWYSNSNSWQNPKPIKTGYLNSAPSATSCDGNIYVAAAGMNNIICVAASTNRWVWVADPSARPITGAPAITSSGTGRLDIFAQDTNKNIIHIKVTIATGSWDGDIIDSDSAFISSPAAISRKDGRLNLFITGADHHVYQKSFDGSNWSDWSKITGDTIIGASAVTSWGEERIDIVGRNSTAKLIHLWWDGNSWNQETAGNSGDDATFAYDPAIVSRGINSIDCLAVDGNQRLLYSSWNGLGK